MWTKKVTNAGKELLAAAPIEKFTFVKAECGSSHADDLENLTGLTDFRAELIITSVSALENVSQIRLQLNNTGINEGFDFTQVALYAQVPGKEPALFLALQSDDGEYIPSQVESPNFVRDYLVNVIIDNAESVTGNIDVAAYVTIGHLASELSKLPQIHVSETEPELRYGDWWYKPVEVRLHQEAVIIETDSAAESNYKLEMDKKDEPIVNIGDGLYVQIEGEA